jgi:hypothetical protein
MINELRDLLKILDHQVDPILQENIFERHRRALDWELTDKLPLIISFPFPESNTINPFPHREALRNPEKMLFNELVHAFNTSIFLHDEIKDDLPYTVRANYGTVIVASIFARKIEQRDDNPPWARHYDTIDELLGIFDMDPRDFSSGYVNQLIETYIFYNQVLDDFPNLKKSVRIVLPDLQGPLDTLELLWGSDIYSGFILNPELVEKGLKLMADAQVGLARFLQPYISDREDNYSHQHATTIKGNILIRNDSAIMISPDMYRRQVAHHDEFVLRSMNGGGVHSCGTIDFNLPEIFRLESIKCFDFGQSYMNDLDAAYAIASPKKIPLIRLRIKRNELLSERIMKRFPTGVSLLYDASSYDEAKAVSREYYGR